MLGDRAGGPTVSAATSPATLAADLLPRARELRMLRPVLPWLRVGAIAFGFVFMALGARPVSSPWLLVGAGVLVAFAVWRLLARPRTVAELRTGAVTEPLVGALAVLLTGGWASPFGLYLAVPTLVVAVAMGPRVAALVVADIALLTAHELLDGDAASGTQISQVLLPLIVAAGVGLVGQRLLAQAEDEHSRTLGRIQQLSHVNALLSTLHDLVRSTPAPLTVEDVLQVIRAEIDELFDADTVLLLLADEGGRWWRPVTVEGDAVGRQIARAELPADLLARQSTRPVEIPRLAEGTGVTPHARSGAYLWLFSRGQPAALLVLEHGQARELPEARLDVLERMSAPLGLAIDNAIWFQRLRTLGAEEERQRIGAALHDQFAQDLAYVSMELDRQVRAHPEDTSLARLRGDVRTTLAGLRETLRELRLRCTEESGLAEALADHVDRFGERFGVIVEFDASGESRGPLSVENQLLRAVQDLLILAQREAAATSISVVLTSEPGRLRLVVRDDGYGVPEEQLGHEGARLLAVVRERVDAVGGLVDVLVHPGVGTEVAITVRGLV